MFIQGSCYVGQRLQLVDNHRLATKYPLKEVTWYRGYASGQEVVYTPDALAKGTRILTLGEEALGAFIKAEGHRMLPSDERDLHDDLFFDPHVYEQDETEGTLKKTAFSVSAGPVLVAPEWALRVLPFLAEPPLRSRFESFDRSGELELSHEGFAIKDAGNIKRQTTLNWMREAPAETEEPKDFYSWTDYRCEVQFAAKNVPELHFISDDDHQVFILESSRVWPAAIFAWLMTDAKGKDRRQTWKDWAAANDAEAVMKATIAYLPTLK